MTVADWYAAIAVVVAVVWFLTLPRRTTATAVDTLLVAALWPVWTVVALLVLLYGWWRNAF